MPDLREHLPDLMFAPLVNDDLEPGVRPLWPEDLHRSGAGVATVDRHAAPPEGVERALGWPSLDQRVVFLVDPVAGVRDPIGQFAIVGQEEQPLAIHVEPSNGEDPLVEIEEIEDGASALGIARGRQIATRLVQQQVGGAWVA